MQSLKRRSVKSQVFAPEKFEYNTNEGKGKEKKKERSGRKEEKRTKQWGTLSSYNGYFGDSIRPKKLLDGRDPFGSNVFKNPARYKLRL